MHAHLDDSEGISMRKTLTLPANLLVAALALAGCADDS
jgi:hypothetical protein